MKRIIAVALVLCLCFGLCACSLTETKTEELLVGEWIWKEYPNNPIYMFLRFEDSYVRYGTNLFGQDMDSATWNCSYAISGTSLNITTTDGTVFKFNIQKDGDKIRIFDDEGHEYVRSN